MGGYHTMDERRKSKRSELHSKLIVKRLDGTSSDEVVIDIIDVSKTGIGFESAGLAGAHYDRRRSGPH